MPEMNVIDAIREADGGLSYEPDVSDFIRMLKLEPVPAAPRHKRFVLKATSAGAGIALIATGAVAAHEAPPQSRLWGVRRSTESVWVKLAIGNISEARRHLDIASRLLEQAEGDGANHEATRLAEEAAAEVDAARRLIAGQDGPEADSVSERAASLDSRIDSLLVLLRSMKPEGHSGPGKGGSDDSDDTDDTSDSGNDDSDDTSGSDESDSDDDSEADDDSSGSGSDDDSEADDDSSGSGSGSG